LAASGVSPPIKRWELSNLEAPVELPPLEAKDGHSGWVMAIAFSPRTNLLISADTGGEVIAWDWASDPKEFSPRKLALPHGSIGIVNAVAFTPDGQTMLSAGSDNNITLWDLSGRRQPLTLKGDGKEIFSIDVSSDGRTLASGGDDRKMKLWDISSRWREQPKMSHGDWMFAVAISPTFTWLSSKKGNCGMRPLRNCSRNIDPSRNGHLAFSPTQHPRGRWKGGPLAESSRSRNHKLPQSPILTGWPNWSLWSGDGRIGSMARPEAQKRTGLEAE
jgi:WD40 repeat protein